MAVSDEAAYADDAIEIVSKVKKKNFIVVEKGKCSAESAFKMAGLDWQVPVSTWCDDGTRILHRASQTSRQYQYQHNLFSNSGTPRGVANTIIVNHAR